MITHEESEAGMCQHSEKVKVLVTQSCLTLWDPMDIAHQVPLNLEFSRQVNTAVGCHFLLQGIFPTQGSNLASKAELKRWRQQRRLGRNGH